jgi:hypothetical protein
MATQAQSIANCANAQRSTGPRTPAGKRAVAQNGLSHGLSSSRFAVLPNENPAEYESLLHSLQAEFSPATAAECFLVEEMARAQWKLRRIDSIEHELLSNGAGLTAWFKEDCAQDAILLKLSRYEGAARRAWYKAFTEIRKLRAGQALETERYERARARGTEAELHRLIAGDIAFTNAHFAAYEQKTAEAPAAAQNDKANPMPPELAAELANHITSAAIPISTPKTIAARCRNASSAGSTGSESRPKPGILI